MDSPKKVFSVEQPSMYKKTALVLQGTHPKDCEWLLRQLQPEQEKRLRALIQEAEDIGVQASSFDTKELLDKLLTEEPAPSKKPSTKKIQAINSATPQQVFLVLKNEPEEMIAFLLAVENWSWSSEILKKFKKSSKANIKIKSAQIMGNVSSKTKESAIDFMVQELGIHLTKST